MVHTKLTKPVQLLTHFFNCIGGDDHIIHERKNTLTARPLFERLLKLALAEVSGVHEAERHPFETVNLRRAEIVARDDEGDLVSVLFCDLKLVKPG